MSVTAAARNFRILALVTALSLSGFQAAAQAETSQQVTTQATSSGRGQSARSAARLLDGSAEQARSPAVRDYATRQASAKNQEHFEGGSRTVIIGSSTLVVVLLVVLIVLLL